MEKPHVRAPRRLVLSLFTFAAFALLLLGCTPAASPTVKDPNAVRVEALISSPLLLSNGDSTVYAVLRMTTAQRPEAPRGPVNIALAIDTSGSMEGEAIKEAKNAAIQMVDTLKDGDRLAVVVYHYAPELIMPSTELDANVRAELKKKIGALQAKGTTEMTGGLRFAIEEVRAHLDRKGINRVILLGDGIPNEPTGLEDYARSAANQGITITTLGLGLDYDEVLMGSIAELSGGRYRYVEKATQLAQFFQEERGRIDSVYGRNASVHITGGPGVRIDEVVGSEYRSGMKHADLPLGDITRGDTRNIVVRMTVTPRKADVPIELFDAVLTFDDALEDAGRLERRVYIGARTTSDAEAVAKAKKPDVELSAAIAEASAMTIKGLALGKQGQYVAARDLLKKGSEKAMEQVKRTPSADLTKLADNMTAVAKDMPEVDRQPEPSKANATEYEFQDDAQSGAPMPAPESPSVQSVRKGAHQKAYESLY